VAKCDNGVADIQNGPQEEFLNVKILEKFMLETSIEVVERGTFEDSLARDHSNRNVRLLDSPLFPDTDSSRQGASLDHKSSQLQVDESSKFSETSRKLGQAEQLEIPPEKNDEPTTVQLDEDQVYNFNFKYPAYQNFKILVQFLALPFTIKTCFRIWNPSCHTFTCPCCILHDVDEGEKLFKKTKTISNTCLTTTATSKGNNTNREISF